MHHTRSAAPAPWALAAVLLCALGPATHRSSAARIVPSAWGPDTVGQHELAQWRDPTFESVSRHFPMLQLPREALGVPEGRDEFVLLPDCAVELSNTRCHVPPENRATIRLYLGPERRPVGEGLPPDAKQLHEGFLPLVSAPFTHDGLQCRQTIFAWTKDMAPDPVARLWAYVELNARNPGDRPRSLPVSCRVECGLPTITVDAGQWTLDVPPHADRSLFLKIPYDGTRPRPADPPDVRPRKPSRHAQLPYCGGFSGVERVDAREYRTRFDETADAWRALSRRGLQIHVPEPRINNAWRALKGYTFLCVDPDENGAPVPHDGAGFYEDVWGVCATVYCQMLDAYGHHAEAGRYLASLAARVSPSGEFVTRFGLADHGGLLVALVEHFRFTGDRDFLARVAPTILRTCRWIARTRAQQNAGADRSSITFGLIRYPPSGDYRTPDWNIMGDAHACAGLDAAARALGALGCPEADEVAREAAAYRADLDRCLHRSIFTRDGTRLLPILPATRGWLEKAQFGAFGYYSLFASMLLETGFLPIDDERVTLLKDALEQRGGLIAGVCALHPLLSLKPEFCHGFGFGYWLTCLRRDEPRRAILALYSTMAFGMTRTTHGGVEHPYVNGRNPHTIPHLRTGSQQLRLLRSLLLREEDQHLILAQGAPESWLEHGKSIRVSHAPTRFGPLDYRIDSFTRHGRITARIVPPTRTPPATIVLCIRHPQDKPIRAARVNGQPATRITRNRVTLPAGPGPIDVTLDFD